jgi:hypothetical protein
VQNKTPDISIIRGDRNETLSEPDLGNHVTGTYRDLYDIPENSRNIEQQDILNFLGPVAEQAPVQNAKLNEREKNDLDSPLSISEFDKAIKQCNKKSAPGTDGISNRFICHFWPYFRVPLLRYAICCQEKGELTTNFKTAKIRLIPKKGDLKKIGNWRPISLLNCFYKLISRVLTNRLKKVIDKITAVGQYGYSKKKQCQEVLIGLLNKIHGAKSDNVRGALISLDIKKAFDSISHSYMNQVLKFFNFGDEFISWINVLCTNREACVILLENKVGKNFKLKRGNAQGDTISPLLFNICYQLLLFKLEYDLQIKDLGITPPISRSPIFSTQVPVSTFARKVFTFADDCNVLCKLEEDSLLRIKVILEEFAVISGLECNLDKTNVLAVGADNGNYTAITNQGFTQKNSLKILGMSVSNNLEQDIADAAGHIRQKLTHKIAIWERFALSLPGRLQIAKTMLYSQLNYLGCFLPFSKEITTNWEKMIFNYVAGNLKIGQQRVFSPVSMGGLGLFRIEDFLDAQKIRWTLYCYNNIDADWKSIIHKTSIQNVFRTDTVLVDSQSPIIGTVKNAFEKFKKKFCNVGNNYKKMSIFGEKLFTVSPRNLDFFGLEDLNMVTDLRIRERLSTIKINDLCDGNEVIGLDQFERFLGGQVPVPLFRKLVKIVRLSITRFHKDIEIQGVQLSTFFNGWKKGSKKFRKILTDENRDYVPHNTIKFAANVETVINVNCSLKLNADWMKSYYANNLRTFIFKLHSNTLPVNVILSHFVRGLSRNCSFCELARNPDPVDETVFHLFFDCPTTEALRYTFYKWLTNNENFNIHRHEFFCCGPTETRCDVWITISYLFKFYIWECRLRKSLPDPEPLKKFVFKELDIMKKVSKFFASKVMGCGLDLNLGRIQG